MSSGRDNQHAKQIAAGGGDGSSSSSMSVTSCNGGDGATGRSSSVQLEARRARRRHRSKINQRKYRAWQRAANNQLQHDVSELQTNTKLLESHVLALYNGERFHAEEKSVQEYLRLFAHGFDRSERQLTFLRYFMAPDVWCLGQHGIDNVIELWEGLGATFATFRLEFVHVAGLFALATDVIIQAKTMAHLKLNQIALDTVLPNVTKSHPDLIKKLKNQVLALPLLFTFVFDATKRVVRTDVEANVFTALFSQLGNVQDVAVALDGAQFHLDAIVKQRKSRG